MTDVVTKSFMERHFGEFAEAVSAGLVAAGQEAHTRSLDAQEGSRLTTNQPYGSTFWLALPQEVVQRLSQVLDGATPFPPRGSQYELLLWNRLAILPVKVIDGASRGDRLRVRTSRLRTNLTSVNVPRPPDPTLFDENEELHVDDPEHSALAAIEAARQALGNKATTTIVAAYSCNPKSGVQAVRVGIGTLNAEGFIDFTDSQRLSLVDSASTAGRPMPVAGETFDAAPRPKPRLEVIQDRAATGGVEPKVDPSASATE